MAQDSEAEQNSVLKPAGCNAAMQWTVLAIYMLNKLRRLQVASSTLVAFQLGFA